jgi:predicted NBD/HSP70 family sugar kinase
MLEQGKEEAVTRWEEYLQILCTAIGNIHLITSSDIILGGPVSHYVKANEASIQRILAERDIYHEDGKYLQIAEAGEDSAIKGAALVFVKKFLKEI